MINVSFSPQQQLTSKPLGHFSSSLKPVAPLKKQPEKDQVSFGYNPGFSEATRGLSGDSKAALGASVLMMIGLLGLVGIGIEIHQATTHEHPSLQELAPQIGQENVDTLTQLAESAAKSAEKEPMEYMEGRGYYDIGQKADATFDPNAAYQKIQQLCLENNIDRNDSDKDSDDEYFDPQTIVAVPDVEEVHVKKKSGDLKLDFGCYGIETEFPEDLK